MILKSRNMILKSINRFRNLEIDFKIVRQFYFKNNIIENLTNLYINRICHQIVSSKYYFTCQLLHIIPIYDTILIHENQWKFCKMAMKATLGKTAIGYHS